MSVSDKIRNFTGACPACTKPIEPGNVITCARCWQLIPAFQRHELRRAYQSRNADALSAVINRVVPIVRRAMNRVEPINLYSEVKEVPEKADSPAGEGMVT